MRIISMRSVAGEVPVIIAAAVSGEAPEVGHTVEGGSGVVTLIAPAPEPTPAEPNPGVRASIRAAEMFLPRPEHLAPDAPHVPESLGYVLARRIGDGLRTLTLDGGS
jgi:hypothetical protein